MPYYKSSHDWLHQSALLLEARPSTTRITTSYSISGSSNTKDRKRSSQKFTEDTKSKTTTTTTTTTKPPRATLTIKTYDPASGATLKYRTTKAAEVSRLVLCLGQLGSRMAGLPAPSAAEGEEAAAAAAADVDMPDAAAPAENAAADDGKGASGKGAPQQQQQAPQAGGGKGKKKRGKK